ncbi:MAG TPA: alpha/beta hydrolase-fold protein, partial [Bacteroidales bacterium]|nr:alpha/beta hydrolase-fold protein [Bacteroidales bacterium]
VIYVLDAQARQYFDLVHSTLAFLDNSQFPMIVIGIVSEERNKDFLPVNDFPETYKHYKGFLGNADKFLGFISDELVPYIDSNYRTLPGRIAIGHSNGGTFLMYSFTKKPDLFDSYILISPNLAYDNEQPVRRLKKFNSSDLKQVKFVYMCHSNEGKFWSDWPAAREKATKILKKLYSDNKIYFVSQDFSETDNHSTVVPQGVYYGLKDLLAYRFYDADHLIEYYSGLLEQEIVSFTPDQLNQMAYDFHFNGDNDGAVKILLWANKLFPDNLNLYDSLGEMYEHESKWNKAAHYYELYSSKLEERKNILTEQEYNALKAGVTKRLESLEQKRGGK